MDDADVEYLSRYVETSRLIPEVEVWWVREDRIMFRVTKVGKHADEPSACAILDNGTYVALYNVSDLDEFRIVIRVNQWPSQRKD